MSLIRLGVQGGNKQAPASNSNLLKTKKKQTHDCAFEPDRRDVKRMAGADFDHLKAELAMVAKVKLRLDYSASNLWQRAAVPKHTTRSRCFLFLAATLDGMDRYRTSEHLAQLLALIRRVQVSPKD